MNSEHERLSRANDPALVKIRFLLSVQDAEQGVEAENLWALDLGNGLYKIDNIPFYVYGISCGDTVHAALAEGRLTFQTVVQRGGHSTYRVLLKSDRGVDDDRFRRLWKRLATMGCSREIARKRLVAIDIPTEADADAVYGVLQIGKSDGTWVFEEVHCGHPLDSSASSTPPESIN